MGTTSHRSCYDLLKAKYIEDIDAGRLDGSTARRLDDGPKGGEAGSTVANYISTSKSLPTIYIESASSASHCRQDRN